MEAPGTWDEYKIIKFNYLQSLKSDLDEDLFTVCLMYYRIIRSNFIIKNTFIAVWNSNLCYCLRYRLLILSGLNYDQFE